MNYSKFYYSLLNLKKVVISTYFNVTIYIEFELFNYLLVYLSNYIFRLRFFAFVVSSHIFCSYALESFFLPLFN
jgi:hypothetical protein